ncbi:glycosyltransferase [Arthrobacter sp.]|uniref:glycosyltransferase n=1 Tax=Arthrobacter sp. TaxID=1667 RepID=UPI003A914BB1
MNQPPPPTAAPPAPPIPPTGTAPRAFASSSAAPIHPVPGAALVDVVVPVHNEAGGIEACLRRLHGHLAASLPFGYRITVADNASTDETVAIAERVARDLGCIAVVHLEEKGRGRALRAAWAASDAPVLAYMDVDLSTDLAAFGPLIAPLLSGHSDVAIGTRLGRGARVVRGPKREFISRGYNLVLHGSLGTRFSDAQCGFKAIRKDVADQLLPHTRDNSWFFDTELLVLAEQCGLRVAEIPVDWTDDPSSSVALARTAADDLAGIWRIGRSLVAGRIPVEGIRRELGRSEPARTRSNTLFGQLVRFGAIGVVSTLAYLALFLLLRHLTGAQAANFSALLLTAIGNTAANRLFTFGIRGSQGIVTHHFQGLLVFGVGLALTSGALVLVHRGASPGSTLEVIAVVLANLLATLVRFVLFRHWVFGSTSPIQKSEVQA